MSRRDHLPTPAFAGAQVNTIVVRRRRAVRVAAAIVEERVRATGDDEATARAYLTSYDLCAKWGDEETKQPDRSRRTRENCPAGCDYVTNCQ